MELRKTTLHKKYKLKDQGDMPKYTVLEFRPKKTPYCLCIPVINEGQRIKRQLEKLRKYTNVVDVLLLDGGSIDGSTTPEFLKKNKVRALLVKKSKGWQATQLRMGFGYAIKQGYSGIIQIDGNNKDSVSSIPLFIKALEQGFDYVQGSRFINGGRGINTPLSRELGIRLLMSPLLSLAAGHRYTDVTNGFRAYSARYLAHPKVRPFRKIFQKYSLNFYLCVRANQIGLSTKEVPVGRRYPAGKVPTKITGIRKNFDIFLEALKAALGIYNPEHESF
ncbi:MAG: glycosyl transferase family 2 [Candidatus Blackburnbacteria bacterium RIFCSPHIGHO2_12_FULL_44_25]|nr:MAG: glycosyl transferase family 2 [Candidatus Blackburnbacteria bacterium RIFCSPHIGHO2_12_FULL_44_25]